MTSDDILCDEVLVTLRRIFQTMGHQSRRLEQTIGLTGPQLRILQAMAPGPSITMGELAARVNLTQGTVTSILDRLARKELIRRERDQTDRRKVHASLTPAGQRLLQLPGARFQAQFVDAFERLPDTEKTRIVDALQRLSALMQDCDPGPAAPALSTPGGGRYGHDPAKEPM